MSGDENSNKKSTSSLLILLLVFAAIVGASWFFFSNKGTNSNDIKQEFANQIVDDMNDEDAQKADNAHKHDHGHNATNSNGQIGKKGKVHELNPPAIYGLRGVGDPNAPVTIQEFFSLTCNHCATFHKETYQKIKKNLINTGKVYFIYQEFPLDGPALYGSMTARCLPEERYTGFMDILLRTQDKWARSGDFKSALTQNAKLAGMSEEEFEACFNNKELQTAVATNIKEASEIWGINSTPSFVINNGERVLLGSQPYETFEKLVEQLMSDETTAETENPAETEAPSVEEKIEDVAKEVKEEAEEQVEEYKENIEGFIEENSETIKDNNLE